MGTQTFDDLMEWGRLRIEGKGKLMMLMKTRRKRRKIAMILRRRGVRSTTKTMKKGNFREIRDFKLS